MEDRGNHSLGLYLKVQRALIRQTQQLLHKEACALLKDRIDDRVDQARVAFTVMLAHQDLVLHMEVTHIIV